MKFFRFLKAVNTHCFGTLFEIPPEHQKLVVDSVVWAFKHTERNIGEGELGMLLLLLYLEFRRDVGNITLPLYLYALTATFVLIFYFRFELPSLKLFIKYRTESSRNVAIAVHKYKLAHFFVEIDTLFSI